MEKFQRDGITYEDRLRLLWKLMTLAQELGDGFYNRNLYLGVMYPALDSVRKMIAIEWGRAFGGRDIDADPVDLPE